MLSLLRSMWGEILFLMGLAGGLWYLLEPPVGTVSGALSGYVAIVIFALALALRCTITLFPDVPVIKILLLIIGTVSIVTSIFMFGDYFITHSQLVFEYQTGPNETTKIVRGSKYQPVAQKLRLEGGKTDQELLSNVGGVKGRHRIWTAASILEAEQELTWKYIGVALSTLFGMICFTELLREYRDKGANRNPAPQGEGPSGG